MKNQKNGLTLIDVLFVVFVVLKLMGVITWSWVWVLSPMWILAALIAVFSVIARIAEKFQKMSKKGLTNPGKYATIRV